MPTETEQLLRDRLRRVLDEVVAGPPPVTVVLRKGQAMRIGSRIAAGVAVVAVCAAGFATATGLGLLRKEPADTGPTVRHHHLPLPTLHVARLPEHARDGVIAAGSSTGKPWNDTWRIAIDRKSGRLYSVVDGGQPWTYKTLRQAGHLSGFASFYVAYHEAYSGLYGVVRSDVTKIVIRLNSGQVVDVHPVSAQGYRWVGLLFPLSLYTPKITVYAGRTELGHSFPYSWLPVTWLRPGQAGPARQSARVGAGFVPMNSRHDWSATVKAGPFGYCLSLTGREAKELDYDCLSPATVRRPGVHARTRTRPRGLARWLIGTASPGVAYVKLFVADGTTIKAPVVPVSGQDFYALAIVRGQVVTGWGAYDSTGHRLYGGVGAPRLVR